MSQILSAFVHTLRYEADGILGIELRPAPGVVFPAFTAGSHIDLHLPNGLERSYSLLNPPSDTGRYVLGVLRDPASRGGSVCVHEQLRVGMPLTISAPRNHFPLHEEAGHSVLVAGGIGITPILCMARRLTELGRPFEVLYFARSRRNAAFVAELAALGAPVTWHFDDEQGGPPDLKKLLSSRSVAADTHYYACGPTVMLDRFLQTCETLGHANAHIERFSPVEIAPSADAQANYTVELKRTGRVFTITPDKSLLHTLLEAGIAVDHSCQEGVCGSCETRVLEGVPDHRDSVLSTAEHASNQTMMICVSGCKTGRLVLDL